jgi:sugar/nucleoside kinase (ribokinase family)
VNRPVLEQFEAADVCVVGHVTKDLIRIPGKPDREMAGGSAFYVSVALNSLGLKVEVITKVRREDEPLLEGMRARGIRVINGETSATTTFENSYSGEHLATREQWVRDIAERFSPDDLRQVTAKNFHVGALTAAEIPLETLRAIRARAERITFDAQGMLREVVDQKVRLGAWKEMELGLPLADALKVDDVEAAGLVGETDTARAAEKLAALGVREVMITFADRGSLIRTAGKNTRIPALPPRSHVDATGCGDTFAAAYLAARSFALSPPEAGRFAAAAASLKLERYGAFDGSRAEVQERSNIL